MVHTVLYVLTLRLCRVEDTQLETMSEWTDRPRTDFVPGTAHTTTHFVSAVLVTVTQCTEEETETHDHSQLLKDQSPA